MSQAPKRKSEGALTTSGSASNLEQTYFKLNSNSYLIVVDYYSKYPELCLLKDKTAGSVITSMKSMFARHGIPDEVVADNMPFSSKSFRQFARDWGFAVCTSSFSTHSVMG